jgi:hypothetical protein
MKKIFLFIVLLPIFVNSQVTNEGKPISWKFSDIDIETLRLPDFDLKEIQKEDEINDPKRNAPWRFGYEHQVDIDIDTNGEWRDLPDGSRIWLMHVYSPGAKTMNFLFDEFFLPEGAKLYFYNEDKTDLLGAYTNSQNREDLQFGSWLVDGESIFIELFEPASKIGTSRLHLNRAVHGYRSVTDFAKQNQNLNSSGPCNLDVDCSIGADFDPLKEELKKSVALIVAGGSGFCSGALINNTNFDGAPYFLTANHCLGGVSSWAFRFNWRSPNPACATGQNSTNGNFDQTASGANLLANNSGSDVALLEITAPLPSSWDLVWAGWDRSSTPAQYTVGIHHPSGDIMKVCRDDNQPFATSQFGAQVWFINEWETGVTEGGSSGSPLFNQDGRIIGQLFGGGAACSGTVNNGQPDWYGRFDVSWDSGNSASSRLKDWLDPNNTGETAIDQYPAAQVFNNDVRLLVSNVDSESCGADIQPIFEVENIGLDPITTLEFNYQLNADTPVASTWNGNIQTGQTAVISSPVLNLADGINILSSSISLPNGIPDEFSNNNSSLLNITKTPEFDTNTIELELLTDDYGNETTWIFEDENGNIISQGGPYNDNITINETFNINNNTCYTFTINDSVGDGICCSYGIGSYSLQTDDGTVIIQGGDFGNSETTNLGINNNLSLNQFTLNEVSIYPNPVNDIINVETTVENLNLELFDISGKLVATSEGKQMIVSHISRGVYLLKINTNRSNQYVTKKIIVE